MSLESQRMEGHAPWRGGSSECAEKGGRCRGGERVFVAKTLASTPPTRPRPPSFNEHRKLVDESLLRLLKDLAVSHVGVVRELRDAKISNGGAVQRKTERTSWHISRTSRPSSSLHRRSVSSDPREREETRRRTKHHFESSTQARRARPPPSSFPPTPCCAARRSSARCGDRVVRGSGERVRRALRDGG